MPKLEKELAQNLFFHNNKNTLSIISTVKHLALEERVNADFDVSVLKTAALFSNMGYLKTNEHVQEVSCNYARKYLPYFDYGNKEIDQICALIMATKTPQKPISKLEELICDASQFHLGSNQYKQYSALLYKEYFSNNLINSFEAWQHYQIELLKKHVYFTISAKKLYNENKTRALSQLMQKVDKKLHARNFFSQFIDLFQRFRLA